MSTYIYPIYINNKKQKYIYTFGGEVDTTYIDKGFAVAHYVGEAV